MQREVIDLEPDDDGAPAKKQKKEPAAGGSSAAPIPMGRTGVVRLTKELKDLREVNPVTGVLRSREEVSMEFELVDEDRLDEWRVKFFYDMAHTEGATNTQNALADALKDRAEKYEQDRTRRDTLGGGSNFIEFRIIFPSTYPAEAPFVYNYYPRMKGSFIFSQGGLCAEVLSTKFGWSCASRASSLVLAVRGLLEDHNCRLQTLKSGDCGGKEKTLLTPFTEEGARKDANSVNNIHKSGWHGSAGNK